LSSFYCPKEGKEKRGGKRGEERGGAFRPWPQLAGGGGRIKGKKGRGRERGEKEEKGDRKWVRTASRFLRGRRPVAGKGEKKKEERGKKKKGEV